jgi:hypothetical protein
MLVGHSEIRKVCAENQLAIVWCPQSFMNWGKPKPGQKKMSEEYTTTVGFLQSLLDELAKTSSYNEIATAPWLPMGESGHLLMVDSLVEEKPEHCIAAIFIKNNHVQPKNRTVPTLVAYGSAQEWSQDKSDIRTNWNNIDAAYKTVLNYRTQFPDWALSYVIDGHSGHFDVSEELALYFAHYIDLMAKARLPTETNGPLKKIIFENGFVADLPVPGHENQPVLAYTEAQAEQRTKPWYADKISAQKGQSVARINWKAETQFPIYLDSLGRELPHTFNGIVSIDKVAMEEDEITFEVPRKMATEIPQGFTNAGEPLPTTPGLPDVLWLSGPLEPLGHGRFRIALDRTWPYGTATYLALRKEGDEKIRTVVQPAGIEIKKLKNSEGKNQKITFAPIADVPVTATTVPLSATSDSSLPVLFYVSSGPAIIENGKLIFTGVPPRTKLPLAVTVCAWQWGSSREPKIKTADVVSQTFYLLPTK